LGRRNCLLSEIPHLDRLGIAERIKLVQDLWDEIAAHPTEVPLNST
jgi:putative addiction module component (TIGR02574 family)